MNSKTCSQSRETEWGDSWHGEQIEFKETRARTLQVTKQRLQEEIHQAQEESEPGMNGGRFTQVSRGEGEAHLGIISHQVCVEVERHEGLEGHIECWPPGSSLVWSLYFQPCQSLSPSNLPRWKSSRSLSPCLPLILYV